ncbi:uncharacterized protein ACLA_018220 [Aspergillus clavatus NRRL 1]|uniref:Uncharacterized protein n=1 Tax=Aspergillus clavatus (strain ATCC 1007 / CBS 513.65 / DSM 816 / NCTC 3887 / NRRL 1 / QM 1276 / 107) TaxID=344612 RepID=A1CN97_ASPCL|nr:uncharacterized protein ACLA_018220 [Aspergillus clavatus NRRL 1]EAW07118.1 conserved hypothetical protein [Aspergillus clavatus NRRL 1]
MSSQSSFSSASPESETESQASSTGSPPAILPDRSRCCKPKAKPGFLWIDSQADKHDSSVGKQKQAFLQRNYQQRKKQASIARLKASKVVSKPTNAPATDPRDEENRQGAYKQMASMSEMWSLKAYLSQGFVDPFSSSAVQMTDSMNLYFQHFRIHTIASCYPLDSARMSIWWWQRAINQPALLQALLFLTAGHQATLESNSGVSEQAIQKSTKDSLRLRGNTLKALNNILQDPIKAVAESTTLIVGSLVAIEAVDANFEALEAHMKGLKRLIGLLGGLDGLDHMTLSKIYQADVKSAALKNSRPTFPMSARWRSEILQESTLFRSKDHASTPKSLSALGTNFFKASWYPGLHTSMKTFIQVLRRLIIYFEMAQVEPSIVMPTDNDLFLVFEHQLLSTEYTETDPLHEPLRHSLLIYQNLRIWHFQSFPFMEFMVEALRRSLVPQFGRFRDEAPELLLWVLFIGGMASQGYKCHPWFVARLTDMARRLAVEGWEKARVLVGGFFYTDQPGERGAEDLWNEVLLMESYPYIAPKRTFQVLTL